MGAANFVRGPMSGLSLRTGRMAGAARKHGGGVGDNVGSERVPLGPFHHLPARPRLLPGG